MSCEQCIKESGIYRSLTLFHLQNPQSAHYCARGRHVNWFGAGNTAIWWLWKQCDSHGVFSRFLFAYLTSSQDTQSIANVLINAMTKHAYLPTTIISDKDTAFMSHVYKEIAVVLGNTLKHATTKHAQTIGLLERSQASIKQALKIETDERRCLWHKDVSIAVLNYNTSYHTNIGCDPSRDFHGGIPYNNLVLNLGNLIQQKWSTKMFAKMPCKLTSNIKPITTKRPRLQNSKRQNMYNFYRRKRIIKEVKLRLQIFGGLALKLLKKCYRTTIIWYPNMARTRRKCFIVCKCVHSHPTNPHLI